MKMRVLRVVMEHVVIGALEEVGATLVVDVRDMIRGVPAGLWWPLGIGVGTASVWVGVAYAVRVDPCQLWGWFRPKDRLIITRFSFFVLLAFVVSFELGLSNVSRFSFHFLLALLTPLLINVYIKSAKWLYHRI